MRSLLRTLELKEVASVSKHRRHPSYAVTVEVDAMKRRWEPWENEIALDAARAVARGESGLLLAAKRLEPRLDRTRSAIYSKVKQYVLEIRDGKTT